MTGRWLSVLASRILRENTFRLIVSPAIADLQIEEAGNRLRGYAGVGRAFILGLLADACVDLSVAWEPAARRRIWLPAALVYVGLVSIAAALFCTRSFALLGTDGLRATLTAFVANRALSCVSFGAAVAAFLMARHAPQGTRLTITTSILLAVLTTAAALATRPMRNDFATYARAAEWRRTFEPTLDPTERRPLPEIVVSSAMRPLSRESRAIDRSDDFRNGAAVFALALAGLAVSPRGRWWIVLRVLLMAGVCLVPVSGFIIPGFPSYYRGWAYVATVSIIAAIALAIPTRAPTADAGVAA